jgi:hypothetical protein
MKNISTGAGLVVLGLGISLHPLVAGLVAQAIASAPVAVASAPAVQAGPTVVWYGVQPGVRGLERDIYRAWSDGTIEMKRVRTWNGEIDCAPSIGCQTGWILITTAQAGYRAAADTNADETVDGVDLAAVLNSWGDAPRSPFPPSDCPLNLINP